MDSMDSHWGVGRPGAAGRNAEPVLVALAYFFGQFLPLSLGDYFPGEHSPLYAAIASTMTAAAAAVLAGTWLDLSKGRSFIGKHQMSWKQYGGCLIAGTALSACACVLVAAAPYSGPLNPMLAKAFLDAGPVVIIPWIAGVVLAAPLGEEMVFRGAIQTHLAQRRGNAVAVGVGAFLFLLLHVAQLDGYWPAFIAILALGIVAGIARVQTGSLIGAITVHAAYNGFMMIVILAGRFWQ